MLSTRDVWISVTTSYTQLLVSSEFNANPNIVVSVVLNFQGNQSFDFVNLHSKHSTRTYSPLKFDGHLVHHSHDEGQDQADGTCTTADREEKVWLEKMLAGGWLMDGKSRVPLGSCTRRGAIFTFIFTGRHKDILQLDVTME